MSVSIEYNGVHLLLEDADGMHEICYLESDRYLVLLSRTETQFNDEGGVRSLRTTSRLLVVDYVSVLREFINNTREEHTDFELTFTVLWCNRGDIKLSKGDSMPDCPCCNSNSYVTFIYDVDNGTYRTLYYFCDLCKKTYSYDEYTEF